MALLLAVYPPITERHFERFVVGHGLYAGRLLGQLEPDAGGRRMVFVQPYGPIFLALEWQYGHVGGVARRVHFFRHMRMFYGAKCYLRVYGRADLRVGLRIGYARDHRSPTRRSAPTLICKPLYYVQVCAQASIVRMGKIMARIVPG